LHRGTEIVDGCSSQLLTWPVLDQVHRQIALPMIRICQVTYQIGLGAQSLSSTVRIAGSQTPASRNRRKCRQRDAEL